MSIHLILAVAFQAVSVGASGVRTGDVDRKAYAPYRKCVLDKAREYAATAETVSEIYRAATADCKIRRTYALQDAIVNVLDYDKKHDTFDGQTAKGMDNNLQSFDFLLRDEVSSAVLTTRLKN